MGLRKAACIMLALVIISAPLTATDTTESWMGADSGALDMYKPTVKNEDMSFLQPIEMCGMAAGIYLACRSGIMSSSMAVYKTKTDLWSTVSNTGIVALTVFAGALLGGVATATAFGPMDPDFETIKEMNLSGGARTTMVISGALLMGAGGYMGYRVGGQSPGKYGEAILIGSLAGAIVGSYLGELLGKLMFGEQKKMK